MCYLLSMKKARYISGVFVLFFIMVTPFLVGQTDPADAPSASGILEKIEKAVDTTIGNWQYSGGEDAKQWNPYKIGEGIDEAKFRLKTRLKGSAIFAGVPVAGTPLHLKLTFYSKGLAQVKIRLSERSVEIFEIDGSAGTGKTISREFPVSESVLLQEYPIVLEIDNRGFKPLRTEFWPPRKNPLKEEGIYFSLQSAELVYPRAIAAQKEVNDWLLSMKTAYTLLNPDFRRFTFTGKPYRIEDRRQTPKERLAHLQDILNQSVAAFDRPAFESGDTAGVTASIKNSYQLADALKEYARGFKVHLIGNAHIDIAWLWRLAETVAVAKNTYATVIRNMDEYPELHYAQSQALTYRWIEEKYPELFRQIKQKVKQGRWEIVGGMWVEPDCNLISGESWVRQILYGKKYFKDKFGIEVDTGWNVDSFGYNWNMPQIYMKSGIRQFVTQKIWWNDTTVFPHYIFWWQGVDGTRLLSYFPPVGYTSRVRMERVTDNITKYEATTGYRKSLILYGIGDHGGGPNREILNRVRDYRKLAIAPDFVHSTAVDFLQNIIKDLGENIPVWNDELYLEYHRGTYTSQADTKKQNRRSEVSIGTAEKLAAIAHLLGKPYPAGPLEKAWKIILTNQFHDILPGSSITPVYRDASESYAEAQRMIKRIDRDALAGIAGRIDTSGLDGRPIVVFNPLSWSRTGPVSLSFPGLQDKAFTILEMSQGETEKTGIPVEIIEDTETGGINVSFMARDVPALGYKVYALVEGSENSRTDKADSPLKADGTSLENRFYRLTVNPETGNISSIFAKRLNREFVEEGKEANVLQIYEDRPENWDAWNIGYTGRMWELNRADAVEVAAVSQVRAVIKVKKSFLGLAKHRYSPTEEFPSSFFTQYITLYRDLERIDIKTEADWWEDHMFLKAAFPVTVRSDQAAYEIPFAAIRRTTRQETLWEKARFEVPALKWADLSQEGYGISLLNDSKYGYDIHGNVMKISLLRAPTWPDPMADRGRHTFTYSLYPHPGQWQEADTVRRGYELNTPPMATTTGIHPGTLPLTHSFFTVKGDGVVLETIKQAEDPGALIFRLFESKGQAETAVLTFFKPVKRVVETNLMEQPIRKMADSGRSLSIAFKKFEIKTIKVELE